MSTDNELSRPELTIKKAATACGVSEKTIRRNLAKFPNAHRLDSPSGPQAGPWVIPVTDLLVAGYKVNAPAPPDSESAETTRRHEDAKRTGTEADELRKRIDALEADAADHERRETELRHEADMARAERDAARAELDRADQTIEAQATALRMLEAGSAHQNAPDAETPTAAPDTRPDTSDAARERATGWLRRTFGR